MLSDSIFIDVGVIIVLGTLNKVGLLGGSFPALAHFVKMSNFMAVFSFGILGRTPLPWLVVLFSTSHALALHPWGFSRLMSRIRRSLLSRFILSRSFPFPLFFLMFLALFCQQSYAAKLTEVLESRWDRLL